MLSEEASLESEAAALAFLSCSHFEGPGFPGWFPVRRSVVCSKLVVNLVMKLGTVVSLLCALAPSHAAVAAVCAAGNPPALPTMISVAPGNASAVITFLPSIGPGPNIRYIVRL